MNSFTEYIKLHILSLEQDWEAALNHEPLRDDEYDPSDDYFEGALSTARHLLSVAEDILES